MADIAILVAEEYERRIRNLKKAATGGGGGAGEDRKIDMVSCVSVVSERLKDKIGAEKMEHLSLNWVWDPKTQIGIAASKSFFSA